MVRPDGALIQLKVDGHVPHMDSSCKAESPLSAAAASKPAPEPAHDNGIDEGDAPHDEVERFVRSHKEQDLVAEASTKEHLFAHYPKNPFCRTCQRAKMLAPHARSKGGQGRLETKAFGDHIILKANIEPGIKGERGVLCSCDQGRAHAVQVRVSVNQQKHGAIRCRDPAFHLRTSGFTRRSMRSRYISEQRYCSGVTQHEQTIRQARLRQHQTKACFSGAAFSPGSHGRYSEPSALSFLRISSSFR